MIDEPSVDKVDAKSLFISFAGDCFDVCFHVGICCIDLVWKRAKSYRFITSNQGRQMDVSRSELVVYKQPEKPT